MSSQDMVSMVILMLYNSKNIYGYRLMHNNSSGYFYTFWLYLVPNLCKIFCSIHLISPSYVRGDINMGKMQASISRIL